MISTEVDLVWLFLIDEIDAKLTEMRIVVSIPVQSSDSKKTYCSHSIDVIQQFKELAINTGESEHRKRALHKERFESRQHGQVISEKQVYQRILKNRKCILRWQFMATLILMIIIWIATWFSLQVSNEKQPESIDSIWKMENQNVNQRKWNNCNFLLDSEKIMIIIRH